MAFQQGLSGLNATSRSLEVIGNNIANASTFGFKASRAEFADMYAASLNGAGTSPIGIGVNVAVVSQQFTQGNIKVSDNPLDLAINGEGFFALRYPSGETVFSRNGQFKVDRDGYIVNNSGCYLLGQDGNPLEVPTGKRSPPVQTTSVSAQFNLRADYGVNTAPFSTGNERSYHHATSLNVYTANGTPEVLQLYFRKEAENSWVVNAFKNGEDLGTVADLQFNDDGTLLSSSYTPPDGLTLNFDETTQFASPFGVASIDQNGRGDGMLVSFVVTPDGRISTRYTNGETGEAGRIGLAKFRNPNGLQPLGDNLWAWTPNAGDRGPLLPPGTDKLGVLQGGALEDSNVDLTAELVNMITAQRMYQANAQTIKTMDQAMQAIVNLR